MDVIRDILDKPLADASGLPVGRVDGIIAVDEPGRPLRLEAVEIGGATLARRVHPRLASWATAVARRFSPSRGRLHRIAMRKIQRIDRGLRLRDPKAAAPALGWERWIRRTIIERIPGA